MDDDMTNPGPPLEPTSPEAAWPAPAATPPEGAPPAGPPPVPGAPPPAGEEPRSGPSWKTWVAVAAGAAVVGAAAVFGISAATSSGSSNAGASNQPSATSTPGGAGQGEGFRRNFAGGGVGTIASINGSNLTLKNGGGKTTKVVTSSKTSVTTSSSGTVGDIEVGDTVTVIGTGTSPSITATRVMDDGKVSADAGNGGPGGFAPGSRFRRGANGQAPDGAGPGPGRFPGGGQFPGANGTTAFTRGTVASVGNGTFTVTAVDGTAVTVTTSSSTTVSVTKTASVSDLKVGDEVVVRGKRSNGTITATNIREGALGGGFFGRNRPNGAPPNGNAQNGG